MYASWPNLVMYLLKPSASKLGSEDVQLPTQTSMYVRWHSMHGVARASLVLEPAWQMSRCGSRAQMVSKWEGLPCTITK